MQTGLYVALSSQMALERRLTTLADNVANAGTVGFRAGGITFSDVMTGLTEDSVSFVSTGADFYDTRAGGLQQTGNPFDFAVQGDAWFAVETPAGPAMTRDGRFTMRETGELVTLEGYAVLDAGGAPLVLDPQAGPPEAGADGILRQGGQLIGAIGLFSFVPGPNATRYGNSAFLPDTQPQPVVDLPDVGVVQGFVEGSNVNPMTEMMRLIQVQRAFEQVTTLVRDSDTAMKDAIKTLGS
ncbi:flagellar basal-body rod protein FlgF [Chelativorans sp. AA-79]|uniref:flagellar basal-body rod protein FlgF n=1 Tax=Chelativorans sp. AA-79 TaxID=3028735 RepID=UPI0023F89748|nr:flagellar basal-body rod protein FlgF [Chelativorans sp. AA-79]WEX08302.1 flagellar basal-body rod protein FlgF [Chelativorans sp. AA-79]